MNKNISLVAIIVAVCASFVSCINVTNTSKRGCGNIVTSERTVSAFEEINIRNNATVRFHASNEFRVVVTTDENLHEYVEIDRRGSTLNIQTRDRNRNRRGRVNVNRSVTINGVSITNGISFTQLIVDVYAPTLYGVRVSGSGSFENAKPLIVSSFETTVSGSGRITGRIESEEFAARISGSGRITVFGSSEEAEIRISGSGQFNGNEFIINDAEARISGSGNANMHVTDNLEARISGSGSIRYQGNPRVDSRVTGSGRIRRVD